MNLLRRIEALESTVSMKPEEVIRPVDVCAMSAAYERVKDSLNSIERPDMAEIVGRLISGWWRDKKLDEATCPEYERMSEDERERLGRDWIDQIVAVINELDSLKG